MELERLGYQSQFEYFRREHNLSEQEIGRIITERKDRYVIKTIENEYEVFITGSMRYNAKSREDFPVVGDWVSLKINDGSSAVIRNIFPRYSSITRRAVGKFGKSQLIASNIDKALIVQAASRDFNINRIERYLVICNESRVDPIIVLSKIDLVDEEELNNIIENLKSRVKNHPVISISNKTMSGIKRVNKYIQPCLTYCLLGSSGAGKSSLLNNLTGDATMKTDYVSDFTGKGVHVTSHREMIFLNSGGIIIDNPGLREVGIADSEQGIEITYEKIHLLSQDCKFRDCTHSHESDCSVKNAVNNGELEAEILENYLILENEKKHFESSIEERRRKDKSLGKLIKNAISNKKRK
ncbi:MAG: ribosome small subunit-dependent GTPase A [Fidelibacterota bacterium]